MVIGVVLVAGVRRRWPDLDVDPDELDGSVGGELPDDRVGEDQASTRDQDPIVGSTADQFGERVEAGGELLDGPQQLAGLEVRPGRQPTGALGRE